MIPTYSRSTTFNPPNVQDNASGQEAVLRTVSNITNSFAKDYAQKQLLKAKTEGSIAGQDPNFQPTKGYGAANNAFNQAALRAQKYTLGSEVLSASGEFYRNATKTISDESLPTYIKHYQAFSDNLLNNAPEENKGYLQNILRHQFEVGKNKILTKVQDSSRNQAQFALQENLNNYANEASNNARENDMNAAAAYLGQHKAMLQDAVKNGIITPKAAATYAISAQEEVTEQHIFGQFENALHAGKQKEFLEKFDKTKAYNSVFSRTQKDIIHAKLQKLQRQKALDDGLTKQYIDQTKNQILFSAQNGAKITNEQLNTIKEGDPDNYHLFLQQVHRAQLKGNIVEATKYEPIGDIDQKINYLKKPPTQAEINSPGGSEDYKNRLETANLLDKERKKFLDDPAGYSMNDPVYQKKMQSFQETGVGVLSPETLEQNQPAELDNTLLNIQRQRGLPDNKLSILPKSRASQIASHITAMPLEGQVNALKKIEDIYGPNSYYAMRDLHKAGIPFASQLAASAMDNPQGFAMMPDIIRALKTPENDLKKRLPDNIKFSDIQSKVRDSLSDFYDSVNRYNNLDPQYLNSITDTVTQVALYKIAHHDKNGVQHAADALINNNYSFDSSFGNTIRIPNNYKDDISSIKTAISEQMSELNEMDLQIPPYIAQQLQGIPKSKQQELYKNLMQPSVVTSPDADGVIFIDHQNNYIKDINGKAIQVKYDQLQQLLEKAKNPRPYNKEDAERLKNQSFYSSYYMNTRN